MIFWLIVAVVALCCSAFFAFSETSVFSIPREKYEVLKNEDAAGRRIYEILSKSDLFLVFLLLGNNFVNIVAITGMEKFLSAALSGNVAAVFVLTTVTLLIFGEVMPKVIAVGNYMPVARLVSRPVALALNVGGGFFAAINSFNLYILRMNYRYLLQAPNPFVTEDEYAIAVNEAVSKGNMSRSCGEMINGFLELSETSVLQAARNRNSLKTVEKEEDETEISAGEIAVKYGGKGEIESVFYRPFAGENLKKSPPVWFPNTKTIGDLHSFFLQNESDCALLLDEYGGFDSAVSRYDIYDYWRARCADKEEILSETVLDAGDEIVKHKAWIWRGALEKYSDIKTISGILCCVAGDIPQAGDRIVQGEFVYHILDADKTRIKKIRVQKT